jgi:hypothetical protein
VSKQDAARTTRPWRASRVDAWDGFRPPTATATTTRAWAPAGGARARVPRARTPHWSGLAHESHMLARVSPWDQDRTSQRPGWTGALRRNRVHPLVTAVVLGSSGMRTRCGCPEIPTTRKRLCGGATWPRSATGQLFGTRAVTLPAVALAALDLAPGFPGGQLVAAVALTERWDRARQTPGRGPRSP